MNESVWIKGRKKITKKRYSFIIGSIKKYFLCKIFLHQLSSSIAEIGDDYLSRNDLHHQVQTPESCTLSLDRANCSRKWPFQSEMKHVFSGRAHENRRKLILLWKCFSSQSIMFAASNDKPDYTKIRGENCQDKYKKAKSYWKLFKWTLFNLVNRLKTLYQVHEQDFLAKKLVKHLLFYSTIALLKASSKHKHSFNIWMLLSLQTSS